MWLGLEGALPQQSLKDRVQQGQDAIYRLDFSGAQEIFDSVTRDLPQSPVGHGMLSAVALNRVLFAAKNLALDDYATPTPFSREPTYKLVGRERQLFQESVQKLIEVCDARLRESPGNLEALYFKGLAFENLATEALAVRRDTRAARGNGKKARNLHESVLKRDPDFVDANVSLAVYEFASATLPWSIKWLALLLGIRGDKEKALARLDLVSERGTYRKRDAQVLLALLEAWKGDPKRSARILEGLRHRYPENFLTDINLAAVYELQLHDFAAAILVYRELLDDLHQKAPGIHACEVRFRMGKTLDASGDEERALKSFRRVLNESCGELETVPLANFYIAEILEKQGQMNRAREHYSRVLEYEGPPKVLESELRRARGRMKR